MGTEEEQRCPNCSTVQRANARFCASCGHILVPGTPIAQAVPPRPWWRQRAVMVGGSLLLLGLVTAALWWRLGSRPPQATELGAAPGAPVPTLVGSPSDREPGVAGSELGATPTPLAALEPTPVDGPTDPGELPPRLTFDELVEEYPELAVWRDNVVLDEENLRRLYQDIKTLYASEGSEGVQAFLRGSGLIEALNLDPNYMDFLMAHQEGGLEAARELARKRGFLTENDELRLTLILDTEDVSPLQPELEALGFKIESHYQNQVNLILPLSTLEGKSEEEILALLGRLASMEHVIGVQNPNLAGTQVRPVISEGVERTGADSWHGAGFTGAGVKVGILDSSFAGYQSLQGDGVPPATINKERGYRFGDGHGTACAEIVHAMAPDATLYLAWFDGTGASLGEAVEWLIAQDVDIISASFGSITGPMDGTGPNVDMVNWAADEGVLWVNAAGNQGDTHLLVEFADGDGDSYHEFPSGAEVLELAGFGQPISIGLNWDESWEGGAEQDYDMLLYEGVLDDTPDARSTDAQGGRAADFPVEYINYLPDDPDAPLYLLIYNAGATRRVRFNLLVNGGELVSESPMSAYSVTTPGDAARALTVGGTDWRTDHLVAYSSQGPTLDERGKPDLAAPTEVESSVYRRFGGTSASTPHVAGAAALVLEAFPASNPESVRGYLLGNARDLAPSGYDTASGYGRLALPAPPSAGDAAPPEVAGATLTDVWVEHNLYEGGQKGLKIHASYDLEGGQNKAFTMAAYFFDARTGEPLPDRNGQYTTGLGQVATSLGFQINTSPVRLTDVALFMPYDELDLLPGEYQLNLRVLLQQDSPSATLLSSELYAFTIKNNGPAAQVFEPLGVNYDAVDRSEAGIGITTSFNVQNLQGQRGWIVAFFYFADGSNRPLRDSNGLYRSYSGNVITGLPYPIASTNQLFENFYLFMPYSELHMAPGIYRLKFFVALYDEQWTKLVSSDWYEFDYSQP